MELKLKRKLKKKVKMKLFKYLLPALLLACSSNDTPSPTLIQDSSIVTDTVVDTVIDTQETIPDYGNEVFYVSDAGLESGSFDYTTPSASMPLIYKGGHVMTSPANIYVIWYGDWKNPKTQELIEYVMRNVDTSAWYQINTSYFQQIAYKPKDAGPDISDALYFGKDVPDLAIDVGPSKLYVTDKINFIKSIHTTYTHGKDLLDEDIGSIVSDSIDGGKLPLDIDGIYFVITAADVHEGNGWFEFCQSFCGWHRNINAFDSNLKIAFIGDTESCYNCSVKQTYESFGFTTSPNDNWEGDQMVSIILHELVESVTDPDVYTQLAWTDAYNQENADKCAWTYGDLYKTNKNTPINTESVFNVSIGDKDFIVQQNWVLNDDGSGYCGLHQ